MEYKTTTKLKQSTQFYRIKAHNFTVLQNKILQNKSTQFYRIKGGGGVPPPPPPPPQSPMTFERVDLNFMNPAPSVTESRIHKNL